MLDKGILRDAGQIFKEQHRLIELPTTGYGIFVGDTHGDLNATRTVLGRYLPHKENRLIFLGDYVDRGPESRENIDTLLRKKADHPDRLYLLQGNHEVPENLGRPRDFWDSLQREGMEEFLAYKRLLALLPYAASGNGLIGLHGAPPDVGKLEDIGSIQPGSDNWDWMVWGDFRPFADGDYMGVLDGGRSTFGMAYFDRVMKKLGKNVLIRSHQPEAAGTMYHNRCLTLMTSHAYKPKRTIAIADLGKETRTTDDLRIEGV